MFFVDENQHVLVFMQVWGISSEDTVVMVRTGVTPSELTGRTWKPVSLPISTRETPSPSGDQSSSTSPQSSRSGLDKVTSHPDDSMTSDSMNLEGVEKVLADLSMKESKEEHGGRQQEQEQQEKGERESGEGGEGVGQESKGGSLSVPDSTGSPTIEIKYPEDCSSLESSGMSDQAGEYIASLIASQSSPTRDIGIMPKQMSQPEEPSREELAGEGQKSVVGRQFPISSKEWSESRLRHASSTSSQGSLGPPREEAPVFNLLPVEDDHLWMWVTGGGCWIKANNMPKW